jgi:hypothetical protein
MRIIAYIIFISLSSTHCLFSAVERMEAPEIEEQFAGALQRALNYLVTENSTFVLTNISQAAEGLEDEEWVAWERKFLKLPEARRRFKTSLWEKYAVLPEPVDLGTNGDTNDSKISIVQTHAFSGYRYVFWFDSDSGRYFYKPIKSQFVERALAKSGIVIRPGAYEYKSLVEAQAERDKESAHRDFLQVLEYYIGRPRGSEATLFFITLFIIAAGCILWMLKRSRRR